MFCISNYSEHPRDSLELRISTYKGIAAGAIHHYGALHLPNIDFIKFGTNICSRGYLMPSVLNKITLHRELTSKNIKEEHLTGYHAGNMCAGFINCEEIIEKAKIVSKKYFPGFKLIIPND
jgi:hypothetical protein